MNLWNLLLLLFKTEWNTGTLLHTSKENGAELNITKRNSKLKLLTRSGVQNQDVESTPKKSFEIVEK